MDNIENNKVKNILSKRKEKSRIVEQVGEQLARVKQKMDCVKHKIAIMSGKGGVGKSTVTVNLAISLAKKGNKVGILDADINGPCIPGMLGLKREAINFTSGEIKPALGPLGIMVASMDLLVKGDNTPVEWEWEGPALFEGVWREQMEISAIREFLGDILWGNLDYLLIDFPPSNNDKPTVIKQLIPDMDGAVIVTIPSKVSQKVVSRLINLDKDLHIPILGLIENMSGFLCPTCGVKAELFKKPDGDRLAKKFCIPFLGRVPFSIKLNDSADNGTPLVEENSMTINTMPVNIFDEIGEKIEAIMNYKKIIAKSI